MKRNNPILGFIIGLLLPLLGMLVMKLLWYRSDSLREYFHMLTYSHSTFAKVLTLSLLINLVPFAYCNTKRLDYTMRGIVIATCLYALLIILIMYVW